MMDNSHNLRFNHKEVNLIFVWTFELNSIFFKYCSVIILLLPENNNAVTMTIVVSMKLFTYYYLRQFLHITTHCADIT